ncbi:hypothetical protein [Auraticoccus monumenti]|uniref:hypothetical protein n=1 Tax=Auraticoccus monumenti TaxID=675864 RepID=UPI000B82F5AA|nr:hypothetical protein [Auraticoccus monumenti]
MSRPGSRPRDVPRPAWRPDPVLAGRPDPVLPGVRTGPPGRPDPVLAGRPDLARPRLRGGPLAGRVTAAVSGVALPVLALGHGPDVVRTALALPAVTPEG